MTTEQLKILNDLNKQIQILDESATTIQQLVGVGDPAQSDADKTQRLTVWTNPSSGAEEIYIPRKYLRKMARDMIEESINLNDEFKQL
jgi:hypothetical protein